MDEIARHYRHLWASLVEERPADERRLLIDRVRDALDRHADALERTDPAIIANSFVTEEIVHQGVMQIIRMRHRDVGTAHAMKTLAPQHGDNPVLRHILLREAEAMLRIDHPNVVRGQVLLRLSDGRPALITDWLGQTLAQRLEEQPLSSSEIGCLMIALFNGLEAIATADLVHGDIAPSNLFLVDAGCGTLKIADFGTCVKIGSSHIAHELKCAARPAYAAPEQLAGEPLQPACDIHASGVLLSRMLHACAEKDHAWSMLDALSEDMRATNPGARPTAAAARRIVTLLNE